MNRIIYKICPAELWREAQSRSRFDGAQVDLADGFIHFSTADQVVETARRHFSGQSDLMLLAVDSVELGASLRWEPSRGGDLFPHLYGPLATHAVLWAEPLPLDGEGRHLFPALPA